MSEPRSNYPASEPPPPMPHLSLPFLARASGGECVWADPGLTVTRISTDTRTLSAGAAFLALTGEKHDAHEWLSKAVDSGARLLIVNRSRRDLVPHGAAALVVDDTRSAYGRIAAAHRRTLNLPLIAIAGSNGKTSTKEMLGAVLGHLGQVVASEASYNNDVGVPATLLRLDTETRAAVVEVGTNHPGELRPLLSMAAPTGGILTSLGREHLEFFGDLRGVIEEEGTLAEVLEAGSTLVVNGDSEGMESVIARARCRVVRCGEAPGNDWRITRVKPDAQGSQFRIEIGGEGTAPDNTHEYRGDFRVNVVGRHMVVNAALALAMASVLGVPASSARAGLESCRPARMRMNLHNFGGIRVIDDAYNANPDSMLAALRTLHDLPCAGRRVAVLGQMAELGPHSETAHEEVGRAAAHYGVERLFAVGRHAELMVGAARNASLKECQAFPDATTAAEATLRTLRSGDTVLVKASRSTQLETVVDRLRRALSPDSTPSHPTPPH